MPCISEFYGIFIYMYYHDHAPAHFHAIYAEHEAVIEVETGNIRRGSLPRRAASLVSEWVELHRKELLSDWKKAQEGQPLDTIPPLD